MEGLKVYKATATLEDGSTLTATGSIHQCANWCENVIRCNPGKVDIEIKKMED